MRPFNNARLVAIKIQKYYSIVAKLDIYKKNKKRYLEILLKYYNF